MDVAVLGAGIRGRAVARHCVRAGHSVGLYAEDANAVMDSVDAVDRAVSVDATDHVTGTTGLAGAVEGAAVVVDTTEGDTDTRRELVAEVETFVDDETLIATGDTTVSVTAVAAGLRRPGRAVGLHFVDPEDSDLVEVVLADQTTPATRDRATEFVEGLDCIPVVVADTPGFAAARLELARIAEAIRMVETGVASVPDVDRAATRGADRRGPLARADAMGLDTVLAGLRDLRSRLGDRFAPPELLETAVESGHRGRQTGTGFYVWTDGDPAEPSDLAPDGPTPEDERY
jgi:3-hydroxybutyryl-CoA dehydrogenase